MNSHATEFQITELRQQIQRLGLNIQILKEPESYDGFELRQPAATETELFINSDGVICDKETSDTQRIVVNTVWITNDLDVTQTLARLIKLPDNCGYEEFWRNVVDSDWDHERDLNTEDVE